jgi:Holliday junction resolvase
VADQKRIRILRQSRRQEDGVAKRLGGRRQPGSGAGWAHKNDVRTPEFLIECKFTNNRSSITLKAKDLESLTRNAIVSGRTPLLQFELNGRRYLVLREDDGTERLGIEPE